MVEKALHRAVCRQPLARLPSSSNPKDQRYLPKRPPQLWLAAVALNPSPDPQPTGPAPPPARTPGFPPPLHTGPGTACCRRHPSSPASPRLGQPQSAAQKGTRQETAPNSARTCHRCPAGRGTGPRRRTTAPSMPCGPAPPPSCAAEARAGVRSFPPSPNAGGCVVLNKNCMAAGLSAVCFFEPAVEILSRETLGPHDPVGRALAGCA